MKKRVTLKEQEKLTAFRPANFFADQLVYARNQNLRQLMDVSGGRRLRMQEISRFGGVQFLDDTACTDVHALGYALESIRRPVLWITGGADAEVNYSHLLPLVVEKVRAVLAIGRDNSRLKSLFSPYIDVYECHTMEQAVKTAFYSAESGDVVLLSSPCDYDGVCSSREDCSRQFREAVTEL